MKTENLPTPVPSLAELYEADETAWLDAMAQLSAQRRFAEMDHEHLSEYLTDMAKRDRREVVSRITALLMHLLKWEYQPAKRTGSWYSTILAQRQELQHLLDSATLRNHADAILANAYAMARKRASAETDLPLETFPAECKWNVDGLLIDE